MPARIAQQTQVRKGPMVLTKPVRFQSQFTITSLQSSNFIFPKQFIKITFLTMLTAPQQIKVGKAATKVGLKSVSKDKESSEKLLKLKSNLKMLKKATESAVSSKKLKKALAKPKKKLLKEVQKKDIKARPVSQAQLAKRKKLSASALKRIEREHKTGIYDEFHKLHVTVVDKHHHVLKPIWDAKKRGDLPSSGVKLLHFDSHPDMATFGSNVDPDSAADVKKAIELTPQIYHDNFDQTEVMRLSDISDWVFTPVLQGLCDEVIWVSGWWCNQLDKNATHEMYCGIDREDGKMKVAIKDDKLKMSMMEYWSSGGFAVPLAKLDYVRPFKMHVVHFNKKCKLEPECMAKIVDVCKGNPWILDIDEDYLSSQNPFTVEENTFCQILTQIQEIIS